MVCDGMLLLCYFRASLLCHFNLRLSSIMLCNTVLRVFNVLKRPILSKREDKPSQMTAVCKRLAVLSPLTTEHQPLFSMNYLTILHFEWPVFVDTQQVIYCTWPMLVLVCLPSNAMQVNKPYQCIVTLQRTMIH